MSTFYKLFGTEGVAGLTLLPDDKEDINSLLKDRRDAIEEKTRLLTGGSRGYVELTDEERTKIISDNTKVISTIVDDSDAFISGLASKILSDIPSHGKAVVNLAAIVRNTKLNRALIEGFNSLLTSTNLISYVNLIVAFNASYLISNTCEQDIMVIDADAISFENIHVKVKKVPITSGANMLPAIIEKLVSINNKVIEALDSTSYTDNREEWYFATMDKVENSLGVKAIENTIELNKIFINQLEDCYNNSVKFINLSDDNSLKDILIKLTTEYEAVCASITSVYNIKCLEANNNFIETVMANERITSRLPELVRSIGTMTSMMIRSVISAIVTFVNMACGVVLKIMKQIRNDAFRKETLIRLNTFSSGDYKIYIDTTKETTCVKYVNVSTGDEYYYDIVNQTTLIPKLIPSKKPNTSNLFVELPLEHGHLEDYIDAIKTNTFTVVGVITGFDKIDKVAGNEVSIINEFYDKLSDYVEGRTTSENIDFNNYIKTMFDTYTSLLYNDMIYAKTDTPDLTYFINNTALSNPETNFSAFKDECNNIREWVKVTSVKDKEFAIPYANMESVFGDNGLYSSMKNTATTIQRYKVDKKWDKLESDFKKLASDCKNDNDDKLRLRTTVASEVVSTGASLIRGIFDIVANTYKYATLFNKYELNVFYIGACILINLENKIVKNEK